VHDSLTGVKQCTCFASLFYCVTSLFDHRIDMTARLSQHWRKSPCWQTAFPDVIPERNVNCWRMLMAAMQLENLACRRETSFVNSPVSCSYSVYLHPHVLNLIFIWASELGWFTSNCVSNAPGEEHDDETRCFCFYTGARIKSAAVAQLYSSSSRAFILCRSLLAIIAVSRNAVKVIIL